MPTRLLLTRHGETTANLERRFAGHADAALTPLGRRQARALARRLRAEPLDAIYASDLGRAMDTARIVAGKRLLPVHADARLREICFGDWEGLTFDEIRDGWPDEHEQLLHISAGFQAPGGELFADSTTRILDALVEILARHNEQTMLLVAHFGTLAVLLQHALGLPDRMLFHLRTDNCSLTEIEFHGEQAVVARVNDCCHLEGLQAAAAPRMSGS